MSPPGVGYACTSVMSPIAAHDLGACVIEYENSVVERCENPRTWSSDMKSLVAIVCVLSLLGGCTDSQKASGRPEAVLRFSDGRASAGDLQAINQALSPIGVRLEEIDLPPSARSLLIASQSRPLSEAEKQQILQIFALSRDDVVALARAAGREPVIAGGGFMATGEIGVTPYPKVYDLRSMGRSDRLAARDKFARLHVNATDDGTGVDEVMTLVAGGPWTWYFLLDNDVAVELRMSSVSPAGPGWRLLYPGLAPHGGHFNAEWGLCIAYITGPETWKMRYEFPQATRSSMLGTNPFVDFTKE